MKYQELNNLINDWGKMNQKIAETAKPQPSVYGIPVMPEQDPELVKQAKKMQAEIEKQLEAYIASHK